MKVVFSKVKRTLSVALALAIGTTSFVYSGVFANTSSSGDDTVLSFDFDGVDNTTSLAATATLLNSMVKSENGGSFEYKFQNLPTSGDVSYKQNQIRFPDLSGTGAYSDDKVTEGTDLDPNVNMTVEDGKLVFRQGGTKYSQQLDITLKSKITTGIIKTSFDLTFPQQFNQGKYVYYWNNDILKVGNVNFGISHKGGDEYYFVIGGEQYDDPTKFAAGTRHFEIVTDPATKIVKLYVDNAEEPIITKQYAENDDLGVGHIYFSFPAYNVNSPLAMPALGTTDDGKYKYEYSFENFKVENITSLEYEASVENNSTGVSLLRPLVLNFSRAITSADGIAVYKNSNNQVVTTVDKVLSADKKTVTITPIEPLEEKTEYYIYIPNTIVAENGASMAEDAKINFTTKIGDTEDTILNLDFDEVMPDTTSLSVTSAMLNNMVKTKNGGSFEYKFQNLPTSGDVSYKQNQIRFPDLSGNGSYSDDKVTDGTDLDPNVNMTIEDGKLVFRQGGTKYSQQIEIILKSKITTGIVKTSFDLTFPEKFAQSGDTYNWNNGIIVLGHDAVNNNVQFGIRNAGKDKFFYLNGDQATGYKNATNFDAGTRHFEIVTDLETNEVKLYMDNGEEPIVTKQYAENVDLGLGHIYFTLPAYNASYPLAMPALGKTADDKWKYEYSIDNFRVENIIPLEFEASIENNSSGISLTRPFVLQFSRALSSVDNIAIVKKSNNQIVTAVNKVLSADKKTVTITPTEPLEAGTEYYLHIPRTVVAENGAMVAEDTKINFTTKIGDTEDTVLSLDFDDVKTDTTSLTATATMLNDMVKTKNGGSFEYKFQNLPTSGDVSYKQNQIRFPDLSGNGAYSDDKVTDGTDLDPNVNMTIEDGKLVFRQGGTKYAQQLDIALKSKITTGIVKTSFDLTFPQQFLKDNYDYSYTNQMVVIGNDAGSNNVSFGIRHSGKDVNYFYLNGDQITAYNDTTKFAAGTRHFEIVTDLETNEVKLYMDNGEEPIVTKQYAENVDLGVGHIYFAFPAYYTNAPLAMPALGKTADDKFKYEYSIDNFRVENITPFSYISNVGGENPAAVATKPIIVQFNKILNALPAITLTKKGDNTPIQAGLILGEDNKTCTLTPALPLDTSTEYVLNIPEVTSASGLQLAASSIEFTTAIGGNNIEIKEYSIKQGETELVTLPASGSVSVSVKFGKKAEDTETKSATLLIALYDDNDELINCFYENKPELTSTPEALTANFSVPSDAEYMKIFVWDAASSIMPVSEAVRIDKAE